MPSTRPDGALDIELLTTGPNAYGYGRLADTRDFAFRVRNRKARLEIYRAGADHAEPVPTDVELVAERPTGATSLDSPRSLTTLLRKLVVVADAPSVPGSEPIEDERTLRAYFVRMDAIMDAWTTAEEDVAEAAPPVPPVSQPRRSLRDYLRRRPAGDAAA